MQSIAETSPSLICRGCGGIKPQDWFEAYAPFYSIEELNDSKCWECTAYNWSKFGSDLTQVPAEIAVGAAKFVGLAIFLMVLFGLLGLILNIPILMAVAVLLIVIAAGSSD